MWTVLTAGAIAGLVSAPHCALMCGPISTFAGRSGSSGLLSYQLGRTLSYITAGVVAGLLGQPIVALLWNSNAATALSWALATLLAIAAYRAWPRKPKSASSLVQLGKPKAETKPSMVVRLLARYPQRPIMLGAFSSLIPCAALWSGLVIAASSASAPAGAAAMLAFSLTSGTGLLASGFLARKLSGSPMRARLRTLIFAVGAIVLVVRPMGMQLNKGSQEPGTDAVQVDCPLHPQGGG